MKEDETVIDGEICKDGNPHEFDTKKSRIEYNTSPEILPEDVIHFEDEFDGTSDWLHKRYKFKKCGRKIIASYKFIYASIE